ncbi:MAG: bifunctional phosphoglucose/phosphomannose isomerase [Candidatus Bathyarchaeota archaeon]|nr:MAG: bifunctional phosphoglucose/phosphomannose isomerase [Candidatus Bathyarchaeota archaeon]
MHESNVLDKPEQLEKVDKSRMLDLCGKTPEYCQDAIKRGGEIAISHKNPRNIIVVGMGGSAIGGEILQDWLRDRLSIPIQTCRSFTLPAYADESTLVFAVSYSGATEETLSAFMDAVHRKCMTITMSSGGHLLSFSKRLGVPHVTMPSGLPPRVAIPYLFFPLPVLLEKMNIVSSLDRDCEEVIRVLEKVVEENSPHIPTKKNTSKMLALELKGTIPMVYGFGRFRAAAHRMKTQFNENSKLLSTYNIFPELDHNEVVGWEASEILTKRFSVILVRDHSESPEIRRRIDFAKLLAFHKAQKVLEIWASGKRRLAEIFSVILTGDFASVYLAILQGVDPTPVKTIVRTKVELGRKSNVLERLEEQIQRMID